MVNGPLTHVFLGSQYLEKDFVCRSLPQAFKANMALDTQVSQMLATRVVKDWEVLPKQLRRPANADTAKEYYRLCTFFQWSLKLFQAEVAGVRGIGGLGGHEGP